MSEILTSEDNSMEVYSQLRAPKSLQRKIARAVSEFNLAHEYMDAEDIDALEKDLSKVIKRVITAHNKGK
jgi:hypothetical protein